MEGLSGKPEAVKTVRGLQVNGMGVSLSWSLRTEFPDFLDRFSLNFDSESHDPWPRGWKQE